MSHTTSSLPSPSSLSSPLYPYSFAHTPSPPYVAVIFTSQRRSESSSSEHQASTIPDYAHTANRMLKLAHTMDGFIGEESVRDPLTQVGITVSYWRDNESVLKWKHQSEHIQAQENGRKYWYDNYAIRVCQVERAYTWIKESPEE